MLKALTPCMVAHRATKKQGGSTKNSKDSHPKFLGVKKFGSEWVIPGNIIIRQRGTQFHPGDWVGMVRNQLAGQRAESPLLVPPDQNQ